MLSGSCCRVSCKSCADTATQTASHQQCDFFSTLTNQCSDWIYINIFAFVVLVKAYKRSLYAAERHNRGVSGIRPATRTGFPCATMLPAPNLSSQQGSRDTYLYSIIRLIPVLTACFAANPWNKGLRKHFNLANKRNYNIMMPVSQIRFCSILSHLNSYLTVKY